jgi:hypothetical protein
VRCPCHSAPDPSAFPSTFSVAGEMQLSVYDGIHWHTITHESAIWCFLDTAKIWPARKVAKIETYSILMATFQFAGLVNRIQL